MKREDGWIRLGRLSSPELGQQVRIVLGGRNLTRLHDTLDPFSEGAVLTSCDPYKNLVVGAFHLIGTPDVTVMRRALDLTTDKFPRLMSGVKEMWDSGRFQHYWEPRPHLRPTLRTSELNITDRSGTHFDSRIQCMHPWLESGRDLLHDVTSEWHLIKVMQDHHILVAIVHHAAADGEVMAKIGKEILANYHEISTGNVADWAGDSWAWSTSRKRLAKPRKRKLRKAIFGRFSRLSLLERSTVLPSGMKVAKHGDQHLTKTVLSKGESERIFKESTAMRLSFVDRLVVSAHLSWDQWNAHRGEPISSLTTSISVNIRHRFRGEHNSNHISYLHFSSSSPERRRPQDFSRAVARSRIRQLRNHEDLKLYQRLCRTMKIVSVLPLGIRQAIARSFAEKNLRSVFQINFMGVIWPEVINGRPTGNSLPVQAGDIEIAEVDAFAYKPVTPMPIRMWVYIYRNELNFVLGWHFRVEDCKPFLELFIKNLRDFSV
jgi:hypothetical protein